MSLRKIAKRQQEKAYTRLHGPSIMRIRGGFGLGRLRPGHRLYKEFTGPAGYVRTYGYMSYNGEGK